MNTKKDYMEADELKVGYLYKLHARNATVGVWRGLAYGDFVISRFKFNENYLFEEYHWDLSDGFGTAKPLEELEKSPFEPHELECGEWSENGKLRWGYVKGAEMLKYLNEWEHKLNYPHPKERPPKEE